jgi:hypothetical protein
LGAAARIRNLRLPQANDTRLLLVGVVAFAALMAYLAVAFANTHAASGTGLTSPFGPWTPSASKLTRVPRGKAGGFSIWVTPAKRTGTYGALVPTLVLNPPERNFVVSLWLKGNRPGPIGITVDEFSPGVTSVYLVQKTVPATPRWHRLTFRGRVKGTWLGLGMYVYRETSATAKTWFAIRDLTVRLGRSPGHG